MPCGQYCYQKKWQCQGGRLRQLTNVQKQPGPTRNYGSEGARQNSIRRRVMSVKNNGSKTNYGPLFGGKKKPSVFSNCGFCGDRSVEEGKNVYYNNGGTSGTNTYWNKIAAGPKGVKGMTCCCQDEQIVTVGSSETQWGPLPNGSFLALPQVGWGLASYGDDLFTGGSALGIITRIIDQPFEINDTTASGRATYGVRPLYGACGVATLVALGWPPELAQSMLAFLSPFSDREAGAAQSYPATPDPALGMATTQVNVTATPPQGPCDKNRLCGGDNGTTLLGGAKCSLGGRNWLNYRRFHPGAAKS